MKGRYSVTLIGLCYTCFCLLSLFNFLPVFIVLPIVSVLPLTTIFGTIISLFIGNGFTHDVVLLISLVFIFASITYFFFKIVIKDLKKKKVIEKKSLHIFFVVQFFIIHPLAFFLYSLIASEKSNDAQFIMETAYTFPISGLFFVIFGFIVDMLKNRVKI